MNSADFIKLTLQLAAMLLVAMAGGELMRRIRQPAVVGEMLGGLLLGPTLLGFAAPVLWLWLFNASPEVNSARDAWTRVGMIFFLFFAGLEVNLTEARKVGRLALSIGIIGTVLPILFGMAIVYAVPQQFWGAVSQKHLFAFSLFFGMNLANSANPVIARVLMDLGLYDTPLGTVTMAATLVDDLVNWTLFAIVLADFSGTASVAGGVAGTAVLVLVFLAGVLLCGRFLGARVLHWARVNMPWPTGFLGITAIVVLLAAGAAEQLGIHAFFGAFVAGVALAGRDAEHKEAHNAIGHFVLSFFAPIYFVSLGMSVNLRTGSDAMLIAAVLAVACVSKIGSVVLGAWVGGLAPGRMSLALGFGLNARGATGIILAGVGYSKGAIDERLFVAMVTMAIITSLMAGPMLRHLLFRSKPVPESASGLETSLAAGCRAVRAKHTAA